MKRSNQIGWAQVRAGVFIFAALALLAVGIIMMGQKTKMFVDKKSLTVVMDDVLGLKVGSPVWLAGVDVGVVTDIRFNSPEKTNEVDISLEISHAALKKIGHDSRITIKTRGLMGEKYVDITPSQQYHEQPATVLRGTTVADGHGVMRVTAVGDHTEIGRTARAAAEEHDPETPLNRQLERLSKLIGVVAFGVAALLFGTLVVRSSVIGEVVLDGAQVALLAIAGGLRPGPGDLQGGGGRRARHNSAYFRGDKLSV